MRFPLLALAASSSSFIATFAVGFVPPPPHAAAAIARPALRYGTCVPVAADPDVAAEEHPPKDDTFGPLAILRDLGDAPDISSRGEDRYDRFGSPNGGVWRSTVLGFLPATIVSFRDGWKWIIEQETAGVVYQEWPGSVVQVLGEKSLVNLSQEPKVHATARMPLSKALSPRNVLELQPFLDDVLERLIVKFEGYAETGQEVAMFDELSNFTLESIAGVYFGDYATPEFVEDIKRYMPTITKSVFSIPKRFPWPLNELPLFGFGKSMDARATFSNVVRRVADDRRTALAEGNKGGKSANVLDELLEIQREQGGIFDDDFIVDNVINIMFAGMDTTSAQLTRMLQLLATADDGKEIVAGLVRELNNEATSDDDELDDTTGTGNGGASREGILSAFPLLDAVTLETFRMHPSVSAVFRKTKEDVIFNGYLIPRGELINWNMAYQMRSRSLYPEPKKFCPFRFLHGDKSKDKGTGASAGPPGLSEEQPLPTMFGLGRHACPGRELAKLEIIMFLRAFLNQFDYELVEGQSFKGVLPTNGPKDKLRVILKAKPAA